MAFDGFAVSALAREFDQTLSGGIITKIAQPENCMIVISYKNGGESGKLVLSADASLPLAYLTDKKFASPQTAPLFCMLLRKHIGSGRISRVEQPSFERILVFHISARNELGDICEKKLIAEFMGKHSNIILTDESDNITDAIKRIPSHISRLREVLPGKKYFIPKTSDKINPLSADERTFIETVADKKTALYKAVYNSFTGFSPQMAEELLARADLDAELPSDSITSIQSEHLSHAFVSLMDEAKSASYEPAIIYANGSPADFTVMRTVRYPVSSLKPFGSVSELIGLFYGEKEAYVRIRQRSADLRKIAQTALERCVKKLEAQNKQLKDAEGRDKYRIRGELLNTYGYDCPEGASDFRVLNYYTNEPQTIPLDPKLSVSENAVKYFEKYNKLKRTAEALSRQITETEKSISHLKSILSSLDISCDESDLADIRKELSDAGYIKRRTLSSKKRPPRSRPLYFSASGFDIYVGKNNIQNEYVTFTLAGGEDWWFHVKEAPGSHVIVKTGGAEPPDEVFEAAASLAAWYSSLKGSGKVEVDYTQRKYLKKPAGAAPGFVIYHKYYSMMAQPSPCTEEQIMI